MSSRFSQIGHEGIVLWNPLPEDETLRLADTIELGPDAHVLDVGCGRAVLLLRILARTGAHGVGVDPWRPSLDAARAAADAAAAWPVSGSASGSASSPPIEPSRLELLAEPFDAAHFGARRFDLALCIGSTHAAGGFRGTLRALRSLLRPGGLALVGEGHWLREPDPDYLTFLGAARNSLLDRAGTLTVARDERFTVERELVSSQRDFDRYEDRYAANVERFVAAHPTDPDAEPFRRRIAAWRAAYLRWGRDTLGFGLYLLRRGA